MRVDYNVPLKDGDDHRRHAHPGLAPDPPVSRRGRRAARPRLPPRPARRRARRRSSASTPVAARLVGAAGPPGDHGRRLRRRRRASRGRRASPTAIGPAARERPLPPGGREERPRLRQRARSTTAAPTIFVNDAFGSAHRAHASTEGVSHHVKTSVAGLLMEKELKLPGHGPRGARAPLRRRSSAGAKVSDKIQVIESLLPAGRRAARSAAAWPTPSSAPRASPPARASSRRTRSRWPRRCSTKAEGKIKLPTDHVVAAEFKVDASTKTSARDRDPRGLDGPRHRPEDRGRPSPTPSRRPRSSSGTGPWASSR